MRTASRRRRSTGCSGNSRRSKASSAASSERELIQLHQNAQRLLKPLFVVNPFVDELTFPDTLTRMRRDHMKYLTLIRAIALLHQHQRPVKTAQGISYIEATREDIAKADRAL